MSYAVKMFAVKVPVAKMSTAKMLMAKTEHQRGSPGLLLNLEQEQVQWILVSGPDLLRKGD